MFDFKNVRYWYIDHVKRPLIRLLYRLKFKYQGGYPCDGDGCIVKLPIKWTVIRTKSHGKELMFSNNSNKLYCRHCLAFKIQDYFTECHLLGEELSDDGEYHSKLSGISFKQCNWTGQDRYVVGGISPYDNPIAQMLDLDVRFGERWWNGHYASEHALVDGLLNPDLQYQTGVIAYRDGKNVYIDQNGITVPSNFSV